MLQAERSPRCAQSGAIAVLMAICLAVIMGFAALGFDLAYVRLARLQMQNASDAAAHAAMVSLRLTSSQSTARKTAETVAAANHVLGNPVQLADSDVVFGGWDFGTKSFTAGAGKTNAVTINGRRADTTASDGNVSLSFGRAIGFTQANVARTSIGAFRSRYTMFEADITGSFLTVSCGLDDAIAADLQFLDALYNAGVVNDKIGLDVFTGMAKSFTPLQTLSANYGSMRASWKGDGLSARSTAHQSGIGACYIGAPGSQTGDYSPCPGGKFWPNEANLAPGIPNLSCSAGDFHYAPTTTVYGGTNIGAGIKSGLDTLSAVANTGEVRSIVIFTDGGPMCCEAGKGGGTCGTDDGSGHLWNPCCADGTISPCVDNTGGAACKCASDVAAYGVTQANAAAAAGVDLYILAFGNHPGWITYAKSLPRGRGFEIDTNDSTQLSASLLQIANNIPVALVQ
ncbi:MAG TPA: pilus assembly protein TadG-related protein [Polyangia bacterium]